MVAEVTVFPVPGGPWIRLRGRCNTVFTAYTCITTNNTEMSSGNTTPKMFSRRLKCKSGYCDMRQVLHLLLVMP